MDVFDLAAKITLDKKDYDKGLDEAGGKMSSLGEKLGSIGGKVASGIGTAMKVGAAAVGAATTAVGALVVKSVEAYSDYEQLVGGVQKLYGNMGMSVEEYAAAQGKSVAEVQADWQKLETAQTQVLQNAQNAYRTAGMSANQYMETATSFSAALINSLGGDSVKAAEMTDVAMRAMSDNWNTFGGDLGMIQGAFQGFAKQNYTMLDNLKLGYGGTKSEMERLIADANTYAASIGQASNLSIESFADIVTAIDLVQQKQQIAGTTAREASTTIQGSLGMVKAAWENLLTGMANGNADLDTMMNNLVDSIAGHTDEAGNHVNGLIDNILPVAEKALESVSTLIEKLGPKIAQELPALINKVLPSLLSSGAQIVGALIKGIMDNIDTIVFTAYDLIETLMNSLLEATEKDGGSTIMEIINWIVGAFEENYMQLIDVGVQILGNIINGIIEGLPELLSYAVEIIKKLADTLIANLPMIVETAFQLIKTLAEGLIQALPELIPKAVEIVMQLVESMIDNIDLLVDAAIAIIIALAEGLINALPKLIEKAPIIIEKFIDALIRNIPKLIECAGKLIIEFAQAIIKSAPEIVRASGQIIGSFIRGVADLLSKVLEVGKNVIENIKKGFESFDPKEWGKDLLNNFIEGIKEKISKLKDTCIEVAKTVKDLLGFSEPEEGPLSNFHTYAPDMMNLFIKGIRDNTQKLQDQVAKSFDFGDAVINTNISGSSDIQRTGSMIPITMNIYGTEGQDVRELADLVSDRLLHQIGQTGAVYA